MEEMEVPTEHLHEDMHERAERAREQWIGRAALSSALLAVLAAISSLLAGHHANEAMIDQIKASDQWSYYQAEGIKTVVLSSKLELLAGMSGMTKDADREKTDREKLIEYKYKHDSAYELAKESQQSSEHHMRHHTVIACAVTVFQVSIAVAAISVLTQRKQFWYVSMVMGLIGLGFLIQGIAIA